MYDIDAKINKHNKTILSSLNIFLKLYSNFSKNVLFSLLSFFLNHMKYLKWARFVHI